MSSESAVRSPRFQAIFFDLFNTLLHFDYDLLPQVEFEGGAIRTTSVEVYQRLREKTEISFSYEHFLRHFLATQELATEIKHRDHREFPSLRRFEILQERLGLSVNGLAEFMVQVHMGEMFRMMHFPAEKKAVVERITGYPLVLASNFDHAPTAHRALQEFGLAKRFQHIFISEDVGWRKPSEQFFQFVTQKSGVKAEGCLYVGDDPVADVYGAMRAGFQVAWLDELNRSEPPPAEPKWILRSLSDIFDLLQC